MQVANVPPSKPALRLDWVDKIILKMQSRYGAKFVQQWGNVDPQDMRQEWAEELAGYTGGEIANGLAALRERIFAPTLSEFQMLCRPPINHEVAFHEAVQGITQRRMGERGEWSHPAIYHAAVKVGQHDLLNSTFSSIRTRWSKALNDQLLAKEWPPVPDAVVSLPAPDKTELSDAEAKAAMDRLGASDVVNRRGRDMKAWARKILDAPKGKSPAVVAIAKRAVEDGQQ